MFHVLVSFLLVTTYYVAQAQASASASHGEEIAKVGVMIDVHSRIGKEQKAAMEVAAQSFNNNSKNKNLSLYFEESTREPLRTASYAEKLIEEKNVDVIIGMESWEEAVIVGKVGKQSQVPVISLVAPSIIPPLMQLRWPFLISMANDASAEIKCIADLVCACHWRRVVVVYEDDEHGSSLGTLALLHEALRNVGSEIEYRLVLPPYSSLSDPKRAVSDELSKLSSVQSRAFIVLRSSLPMLTHLSREAKEAGLLETDSAWIMTESVTNLLDYADHSVISSMKGALGIKTYYSNDTSSYKDFHVQFQRTFLEENPGEATSNPGVYALRAYDSILAITQALERIAASNANEEKLIENILSANFEGLSGNVSFKDGKLLPNQTLRIVNVVDSGGKEQALENGVYKEQDIWTEKHGFSKCLVQDLNCSVVWPGNLVDRKPKGWAMPTIHKKLKIAVPAVTQFNKFVTVDPSMKHLNEGYDGFCIQIFRKALQYLNYEPPPYQFIAFTGSYDELIDAVYNKTYDAIVGDMTILVERARKVEFTQPFAESGLQLIVPINSKETAWMFTKPFTRNMWVMTLIILVYTMLVIWFLEHPTNPEFSGTVKNQIGTAFWFTCSSLFFAQKERVHSNITRVAVFMWLFVVFILTASYTASLSSTLTVKQLKQDIDIDLLRKTNKTVGCYGNSFVRKYLEDVLHFKPEFIYDVKEEDDYLKRFKEHNITAGFLEVPYEKVFINNHCNQYTSSSCANRFGGLGFVFQKGSPITRDISEAILKLLQQGNITDLEKKYLTPSGKCSSTSIEAERLSLKSFWGIYLISGSTSTICFFISLIRLLRNYREYQENSDDQSIETKAILNLARYFYDSRANNSQERVSTANTIVSSDDIPNLNEGSSSGSELIIPDSDTPQHLEITTV
ncbi:glutamate receptor 2.7-like [Humulus lupulus]|uniref:glutamate receptor 2.7-like n=1 Tax=Humulus lupulus TaxID=3486 RepID=UPI002B40B1FA|nr:glutamate receptor 2.7-like [Humulus lupulus]